MTYDWILIETAYGRKLYKDRTSHFYAICETWQEPQDADACIYGITPESQEWFWELWENDAHS